MTWFDLIIVAVIVASTAFAVIRGALREVGTLAVLAGAGAGGYFLLKPVQSLLGLGDSFMTTAAVGGALAFLGFVALYFLLHAGLQRLPLSGRALTADRIGGGVFGLARGLALIGLGFLAYSYYLDEARRPAAIANALTLPMAKTAAAFFESFAPAGGADLDGATPAPDPQENAAIEGYGRGDRTALAEIVSTVTTAENAQARAPSSAGPAGRDAIAAALTELEPE